MFAHSVSEHSMTKLANTDLGRCPDCGLNLTLVGRAHNCRPRPLLDPGAGEHQAELVQGQNTSGMQIFEAEMSDRLASLRSENGSLRLRLDDAVVRIAELEAQLSAVARGECPLCLARKEAAKLRMRNKRGGRKG